MFSAWDTEASASVPAPMIHAGVPAYPASAVQKIAKYPIIECVSPIITPARMQMHVVLILVFSESAVC